MNVLEKINIKKIVEKNTVVDIFKDINQDPSQYRPQGIVAFMAFKFGYKRTKMLFNRVKLILSMKSFMTQASG